MTNRLHGAIRGFDEGFHAGWEAAIEEALIKIELYKEAHPSDIAAHVAALAETSPQKAGESAGG